MPNQPISIGDLPKALQGAYPELDAFGSVGARVYLVGGAVRDLLLGRERGDLDVVVVGNPVALAERLGAAEVVEHERLDDTFVDALPGFLDAAGSAVAP